MEDYRFSSVSINPKVTEATGQAIIGGSILDPKAPWIQLHKQYPVA